MNKIKNFFKDNYKEIIFVIIFAIVINYPLPYYIFTGGGISSLNEKYTIENATKSKGSYGLSYVREIKSTTFTFLLSKIIPEWDSVSINDYKFESNESLQDLNLRDKMMLEQANRNAAMIAYERAGKDFKITNNKYLIAISAEFLKSDKKVKIGDELVSIDNIKFDSILEISKYFETKNIGDKLEFEFKRNNENYKTMIEFIELEGKKVLGIAIINVFDFESNPKIEFNFNNNESGPSAGFMLTLSIYDSLIEEDLTKGLKIVGTGTIDYMGNVGEISGIKYKLIGAVKDKADVFFAPIGDNYDEAIKIKEKNNYKIDVIGVKTIDDAINYLKNR